jgi:catechol 2,3-dioxygenase-like lactoylglutathione lyase family enzyme
MRINLTSVFVDDQRAALAFYTDVLGFVKHRDVPLGDDAWLTDKGVVFTQPPLDIGTAVIAVFDDTCGNLVQIISEQKA